MTMTVNLNLIVYSNLYPKNLVTKRKGKGKQIWPDIWMKKMRNWNSNMIDMISRIKLKSK